MRGHLQCRDTLAGNEGCLLKTGTTVVCLFGVAIMVGLFLAKLVKLSNLGISIPLLVLLNQIYKNVIYFKINFVILF